MFALGFLLLMATSTSTILSAYAEMTVFGHKVPDTDAISAALVYVWELGSRNISAKAYRLGELNPETSYVLESLQVAVPPLLGDLNPESQVAIVDTNNPDELPINISKMKIHSIVDHHKLNGLSNAEPLELDFRPLCSVGSILYARAKALGLTPTKQIAGLMLSGILSDSLGFRSPTTTDIDKIYATELGELAELDVHDHAENMLEAKAQLDDYSVEELVMMDTKIFRLGGKMMRVSVIETTKPLDLLAKKAALVEAQSDIAKKVKLLPGPSGCVQPDARACRRMFLSSIRKGSGTFSSSSSTS
mmetsp:Transcript_67374/g.146652  ORF Transcript_67374/g.146652 Transcript_67374/m.146652 type:complete len:304 (-) Transcript_67374:574-1485(-)